VVAQFGVVFLLFSIGLSLSIERLGVLRRWVFGLGVAQMVVTVLALWGALLGLGLEAGPALVLGGALALSSTAVALQMLEERRELGTAYGRAAFAVLLLQDLAVVPLLTLVPLLRGPGASVLPALGLAFLRAAVALVAILAAGRLLLRPALRVVARDGGPELFTAVVLLLVLGIGWLTEGAGLSMALGAFLAGVLVAETEFRPQVEADVLPFRGVLLALFFMTVGMGLDPALAWAHAPLLLGLLAGLLVVKAVILAALGRAFGLSMANAAAVGLTLAQGGEFAFVLVALARGSGVVSAEIGQLVVLVVGLSMAATPLLFALKGRLTPRLERLGAEAALAADVGGTHGHVIVAGFGRVGWTLARLLEARGTPYVALDLDPERVAEAAAREQPVHFGDASRPGVLRAAGIERARAVVVTLDEPKAASRTVHLVRSLAPELPVVVRARDLGQCEQLALAGASAVVPELVEGSLQLGAALLGQLGESRDGVERLLGVLRRETYARLTASG
jgi:CPA2 family monovalent cation:H+ antiporter-2